MSVRGKLSVKIHSETDSQLKPIDWPLHGNSLQQKVIQNRYYNPFEKFPSPKDSIIQKLVNLPAIQANWTVSTRHKPPPKCISEHTTLSAEKSRGKVTKFFARDWIFPRWNFPRTFFFPTTIFPLFFFTWQRI